MSHTILIVDDEESIRTSLRGILEDEEYRVVEAASGEEALRLLVRQPVDAILLDIWMEGIDGIETLDRIKKKNRSFLSKDGTGDASVRILASNADAPVIMMSGHGTINTAVMATKSGAYDFLEKPLSLDRVLLLLERAIRELVLVRENRDLKARVVTEQPMIGDTPVMRALDQQIRRVAPTSGWVLITGENGTGKEVASRRIHKFSQRAEGPFITVNSAAIPENLIESELFGHEAGGMGEEKDLRVGRFEQGHRGTVFLDEIGDMALNTQAKILRILQEQRFQRVGGSREIQVDVRVIAASNKNLEELIARERFRADLFYRLNVIPLRVPPLRERREDIPALVTFFISQHQNASPNWSFAQETLDLLGAYHWPGNVRELKNLVERLLIMAPGPVIRPEDLPEFIVRRDRSVQSPWDQLLESRNLRTAREEFERHYLGAHLARHQGNISRTAEAVGMERSALHRKLKSLGLGGQTEDKTN
ncbi:MAG: sigma-54-dependent Fis family transcriptional regulator [Magnetococcales bacterium]|nr:sigma-54-dependent Fis family transcriptional regulator [Magnetococcales bacterium]